MQPFNLQAHELDVNEVHRNLPVVKPGIMNRNDAAVAEVCDDSGLSGRKWTADLLRQYGCGPVTFSGDDEALYERHLMFDRAGSTARASARDKFEAAARSARDVLSQRWVKTEETYQQRNAKRIYYLSMEFLLGRTLANNISNLRLAPILADLHKLKNLDPRRNLRAGARPWIGQRRSRQAGGVFSRLDGHARHSRHGLRVAL